MPNRALSQKPPPSPVERIIHEKSRMVMGDSLSDLKRAAKEFERALASADLRDDWWQKAQYDLGYDLMNAGEYESAAVAFEKVLSVKDRWFGGLSSPAADELAQCLTALHRPAKEREEAYRRALLLVSEEDPFASYALLGRRSAMIDAIMEGSGKDALPRALEAALLLAQEGYRGKYCPRKDHPLPDFDADTWREVLSTTYRNIADAAAKRKDPATVSKTFAAYKSSFPAGPGNIAFAEDLALAGKSGELSSRDYAALLKKYPQKSPARAGVLMDALIEATVQGDCARVENYAKQILAIEPVAGDPEDPRSFYPQATRSLRDCREPKGGRGRPILLHP